MICPGYCQRARRIWVQEARAAIRPPEVTAISPEDALEYARELRADLIDRLATVEEEIGVLERVV